MFRVGLGETLEMSKKEKLGFAGNKFYSEPVQMVICGAPSAAAYLSTDVSLQLL